jgi:hypothetical protein
MNMQDRMRNVSVITRERSKVLYLRGLKMESRIGFGVEHVQVPGNETNEGMTGLNGPTGRVLWSCSTRKVCTRCLGGPEPSGA